MPGHPASVVRSVALLLPLLASILVAGALSAQCELPRLGVGETAPSARFGSAIDFSAEWAAVGAPNRDFAGSDSGAVHLFRRDGDSWVREARIAGSDTAAGDSFGASLALQGDILVVGAPHHAAAGPYSGAVYVFRLTGDGWVEEVKLLPDTVAELERFGLSVAIDGDAIVVGSSRDRNSEGVDTGSVTVFRHTDAWSVEALLFAPDGAHLDYFGIDVAISGDRLIAGAGGDDDFGSSSGAVYVFQHDATGWSFEAKLTGSDIDTNDRLGLRVDLEGTTVAAGAPGQAGLGAVYLFTLEGDAWIEAQKLQPAGLEIDDFFGYPVKLDGDRLAVGALEAGDHEGAVHVFLRSGQEWIAEATVTPFDAMSGDRFGHGIAIAGDEMLVGTRWRADAGISSGAVYQLNSVAGDWIAGMKLSPVDAEEGDRRGAAIAGDGQRLAIGAPGDSEGTSRRGIGSVRVFSADGPLWFEEARLTASDAASLDGLGEALAIAASLIVAGAPAGDGAAPDSGAAYAFRELGGGWLEEAKLTAGDGAPGDRFGAAVATAAAIVAVGAPLADAAGPDAGAVYIYEQQAGDAWLEVVKLEPALPVTASHFGAALLIAGDTLFVGVPGDASAGADSGAVVVFRSQAGQWISEAVITASNGAAGHRFGSALAFAAPYLAVGAPAAAGAVSGSGSVYIFRQEGAAWIEEAQLFAADGAAGEGFGSALSIAGESLLVGAPAVDTTPQGPGRAHIFERAGGLWPEIISLASSDGLPGDELGAAVHLAADRQGIAGAPGGIDVGIAAGTAVPFWTIVEADCNANGTSDICDIFSGVSADCNGNYVPDDCDLASGASIDTNGNQVPDECENRFLRGDCNVDGAFDIGDAIFILTGLFIAGPLPPCEAACDVNGDSQRNIADAVAALLALFQGGAPPPPPYPDCGIDPNALSCDIYLHCP